VPSPKPSLALLRSLSDEHVLRALMADERLTRAELASRTGLSKPTVSESVRRLTAAGLLRDTGERTSGRGRVGLYYALADAVGTALVVSVAPGQVVAETIDPYGKSVVRASEPIGRPARPAEVRQALRAAAELACAGSAARLAVVSAADPVDRASGRLVHLPDAPFLVGELDPVLALAGLVTGPVTVDNDVNWAARAERETRKGPQADDFVYLFLGEGLGLAVVSDGEVRRGHSGIAGEIAHLLTTDPDGKAEYFTDVFRKLDLRLPDSTAIDVDALLRTVSGRDVRGKQVRRAIGSAVAGVLAAAVALLDPALIVVGGPWGSDAVILEAIRDELGQLQRRAPIEAARSAENAPLIGARNQALADLRAAIATGQRVADAAGSVTPKA
jgi:predicted NBD/HSP70 family sugar kinase